MSRWNPRIAIPRLSAVAGYAVPMVIGFGVICRVGEFLWGRELWLDESSLAANIREKSLAGLFGPLLHVQLAPPGFLVLEWLMARGAEAASFADRLVPRLSSIASPKYALRLVPLLSGIASLFLFSRVARRCLSQRGALIALGLFAVSDDLIYYAAEVKQYSSDVALGVACYLAAFAVCDEDLSPRRFGLLAVFCAAVVWFSHPAVFILAGTGVVSLVTEAAAKRWRQAAGVVLLGLITGISFACVYAVSRSQLGPGNGMWAFWDFTFPPTHVRSLWDASWPLRRFAYLFVNPLSFNTPLGHTASALLPLALFGSGVVLIWSRNRKLCVMLLMPGALTLLAALLRLYPFHGRLVLFLVPSLLLFIAEGVDRIRPRRARWLVFGVLFLFPTLTAIVHLVEQREPRAFNPRGDLRPPELDPARFPLGLKANPRLKSP